MAKNSPQIQEALLRQRPTPNAIKRLLPMKEIQEWTQAQESGRQRVRNHFVKEQLEKTLLKKAMPYLLVGGSTGVGLGIGLSDLLL